MCNEDAKNDEFFSSDDDGSTMTDFDVGAVVVDEVVIPDVVVGVECAA
jgi:hypothetical protein